MLKKLGKLNYLIKNKEITLNLNEVKTGVNIYENFIIFKMNNNIKIFDRKCDHAGGKIISKDGNTICPIHMWKFNPSSGYYDNGVKKKEIQYSIDKNLIKLNDITYVPKIDNFKKKLNTEIRFFNHAFLKIIGDDFSFSTDPWAIGPAFNTGWWLAHSTKIDWIDQLNNSNFIYISHNHPDHCHELTLSYLKKDIPMFPENIGVLTAKDSHALKDVCSKLKEKYPLARVCVYPSTVQGASAPMSLAKMLNKINKDNFVEEIDNDFEIIKENIVFKIPKKLN